MLGRSPHIVEAAIEDVRAVYQRVRCHVHGQYQHCAPVDCIINNVCVDFFSDAACHLNQVAVVFLLVQPSCLLQDPATTSYSHALLHYKGFHAIQAHRIANDLWTRGERAIAAALQVHYAEEAASSSRLWLQVMRGSPGRAVLLLCAQTRPLHNATPGRQRASHDNLVACRNAVQSRMSEVFAADIHPGARFGKGILLDHGQLPYAGLAGFPCNAPHPSSLRC